VNVDRFKLCKHPGTVKHCFHDHFSRKPLRITGLDSQCLRESVPTGILLKQKALPASHPLARYRHVVEGAGLRLIVGTCVSLSTRYVISPKDLQLNITVNSNPSNSIRDLLQKIRIIQSSPPACQTRKSNCTRQHSYILVEQLKYGGTQTSNTTKASTSTNSSNMRKLPRRQNSIPSSWLMVLATQSTK
jgi:hypothetical protein